MSCSTTFSRSPDPVTMSYQSTQIRRPDLGRTRARRGARYQSVYLRRLVRIPEIALEAIVPRLPGMAFLTETRDTQTPIRFRDWLRQEVFGINRGPYWPVHGSSRVVGWRNILAGIETSPGGMPGCYIQAIGKVRIGDYTQIGPNVNIISANHRPEDLREHLPRDVTIGRYCWLGAGCTVLPGVTLGDFTIVGAGSVVTKSFPEGYTVIAGNPARAIRALDPAQCLEHRSPHEYNGYLRAEDFSEFRRAELNI